MGMVIFHPHLRNKDLPDIDRLAVVSPFRWLRSGWRDLWRAPLISLGYGLVFAWLGYFLTDQAWAFAPAGMALTSGFLFVAPFLAIGFYDLSRQMEGTRARPSALHTLTAWRVNGGTIGFFALLLCFSLSVWERISAIMVGLFLNGNITHVRDFADEVLAGGHLHFLLAYGLFETLLAVAVFSRSVVSMTMMMDRKVDLATALTTSLRVARENPLVMLVWAALIACPDGHQLRNAVRWHGVRIPACRARHLARLSRAGGKRGDLTRNRVVDWRQTAGRRRAARPWPPLPAAAGRTGCGRAPSGARGLIDCRERRRASESCHRRSALKGLLIAPDLLNRVPLLTVVPGRRDSN
ncbi:MAG: DUF2189 domain-containing protein [Thiobacillaceae bacterium]